MTIETKILKKNIKTAALNPYEIQKDFPILNRKIHGHRLAYLDNAATTQKPQCMIEVFKHYYEETNANIHRGVHHLSEIATKAYEDTRQRVKQFINAPCTEECIFTRGTTDAINLVAHSFSSFVKANDEILISAMEHHSNIVPWQMLCERTGAQLKIIPMNVEGELDIEALEQQLSQKTKLLAITHVSNALGTINPIADIIQKAHAFNIPVLVDGAQAAPHLKIDVQALDCDFYTFSGHKMYGPTGVGVLYGKKRWLNAMPPYQGGGEMILSVTFEKSEYQALPFKFEAGTPPIAEVIALGTSIQYLESLHWESIQKYEKSLLEDATRKLSAIRGLKIIGTAKEKAGVISFVLDSIHPHDIGSIVDQYGVAIRTGHHCAMPTMDFFKIPATARVSFGIYNTVEDIDQLVNALYEAKKIFKST